MSQLASPQEASGVVAVQRALAGMIDPGLQLAVALSHAPDVVLLPRFRSNVAVEEPLLVRLIYELLVLSVFRNPVGCLVAEGGRC